MASVPQTPVVSPLNPHNRWPARIYPGQLAHACRVRDGVRADLAGFGADLGTAVWAEFPRTEPGTTR